MGIVLHIMGRRVEHRAMRADRETYTHGHAASVLRSHTVRTVANSAAYAAAYLRPGADVLDVGCGPGTITVDIKVDLPASTATPQPRPEQPLYLSIKEDRSLYLGNDAVAAEQLGAAPHVVREP